MRLLSGSLCGTDVSGVVVEDFAAESRAVDMEIDFCCCDAFVAEHLLDCAQVGTSFEEVGGERVAESVGRDLFVDACPRSEVFYDIEDHHAAQASSPSVEEKDVLVAPVHVEGGPVGKVELDFADCYGRHGH